MFCSRSHSYFWQIYPKPRAPIFVQYDLLTTCIITSDWTNTKSIKHIHVSFKQSILCCLSEWRKVKALIKVVCVPKHHILQLYGMIAFMQFIRNLTGRGEGGGTHTTTVWATQPFRRWTLRVVRTEWYFSRENEGLEKDQGELQKDGI